MSSDPQNSRRILSPWLLRRGDQAAVGGLVVAGFVAMGIWWVSQGGWAGRLVEIERAEDQTARFQVDLNAAQWPELAQLPGIGETLARRIVESREADGPFLDHEDIQRVRGIGPKTLEGLRPHLLPMPSHKAIVGGQAAPLNRGLP